MRLTREQAAIAAQRSTNTIRTWERRGRIQRAGTDADGRVLYRAADLDRQKRRAEARQRAHNETP